MATVWYTPGGGIAVAKVYFIAAPSAGLVKIGHSFHPGHRLRGLQTLSPVPLTLLGSIPGGQKAETQLHRRFADYRSHGEWFRLEGDLAEYVREVTADAR
jgi:hypothetical protein